jgi:predicted AAA+ superfamily ATPase
MVEMIYRDIYKQLKTWALNEKHKPLILRGARQVGKTTVVDEFSHEFDNYIHLNLERAEDAKLFLENETVNELMQLLCFRQNISMGKGRTLLFIDEIQNVPKAVAMLRYFYEDMPELYVIAAGSRLQSLLKERVSFPVGRVEYMQLTPCSFGEFLGGTGDEQYKEAIENADLPAILHEEAIKRFNMYAVIGGMPEIVADYAEKRDLTRLRSIYNTLLMGYNEDVEKYAPTQKQTAIIRHILKTGWSKAGQAITLTNFGGSQYLSKDVREAFMIMEKAFLLELVYPATSVQAPIEASFRRSPKLRWVDTGLVNFAVNLQVELLGKKDILDTWQGSIGEQIVGQELRIVLNKEYVQSLNYWVRDKKGSNAEVDYILQRGMEIIPIEVKSGHNSHLRSLQSFMDLTKGETAVRVWSEKFSVDEVETPNKKKFKLINVPFYYVGALPKILDREMKG